MSFVISNSFYQSLPIRGYLDKLAVLPKQQFQTTVADLKQIRAVIQDSQTIYRCVLKDGKLAMKFINMVKIFYEPKAK